MTRPLEMADTVSLGEAAAIGRIEKALFGGDERLVRVGRYEVIEPIGAGAFGKVYRARDPQLDRTIALKVLAVEHARGEDLLGEAKVMATIGHPNVAAIHDAGVLADAAPARVFLAMELVDGKHLRDWLSTPRTRPEILEVMRQAGRGLAAAHAAGIVHRDFKPENLLVGGDGRVRVVDFGLARTATAAIAPDTDVAETSTATVAGTPAYMAPELFDGAPASALTDQFAFCITLWEALYGGRPFPARSVDELRAAFERPVVVPRRPRMPRRVVLALARGLATDPARRHPAMDALVAELEPRRSARWLVAAAVAIAGLATALALALAREPAPPDPCPRATGELAGVWDAARRTAIAGAFRATGVPHAPAAFDRLAGVLDRATGEWLDAHHAACATPRAPRPTSATSSRPICSIAGWRASATGGASSPR
jgi:eukaryotic-like serine/threonine-protein kinase